MKNAKLKKIIKEMRQNCMQNNAYNYQQRTVNDANMDFLEKKEEEAKQYEQINYNQLNYNVRSFMLLIEEMQKKVHKMEKLMQKMTDSIEKNSDTLQKIEEELERQSEDIDWLYKKVSKQKKGLKKEQLQNKKLKKSVHSTMLGINSLPDHLEKILKKRLDKTGAYDIQGSSRKEIFDTNAYFE